jgi:flavodoxin I
MKKTGLFYSFNTYKTARAAEKIQKAFGDDFIESVNVETVSPEQFESYDTYVLGVPTWFDGELPNYWDEFVPAIEDMDLSGKQFAIFGLGDQKGYPQNFGDAVGIMAQILEEQGATLVGKWPTEGYTFSSSRAIVGNNFLGLILDQENQGVLTNERIVKWVEQLKKEFNA